jgi:glycosyltransferase involved in cell wall biosynthesis
LARKQKISAFVHDLSGNPIVRAFPILKAFEELGYEVEVLGFTYNTDKVYAPYKDAFTYKTVRSFLDIRWVVKNAFKLAKMADGDLVYAFKPVWDSFFPALLYSKMGWRKKMAFDAEDNELYDAFIGYGFGRLLKAPFYPINPIFNFVLHPLTWFLRNKTVVCRGLQKRYGGHLILHGPDIQTKSFPTPEEIIKRKVQIGINESDFVVLFAGRPVFYNGIPKLIKVFQNLPNQEFKLLLVGNPEEPLFVEAKKMLGDNCILAGLFPNSEMELIFRMAHIVPILQDDIPSTRLQVPAKLLEAMARKTAVVGTRVGDIPYLLAEGRGVVLENDEPLFIAETLKRLNKNRSELSCMAEKAEIFAKHEFTVSAIKKKLEALNIFNDLSQKHA